MAAALFRRKGSRGILTKGRKEERVGGSGSSLGQEGLGTATNNRTDGKSQPSNVLIQHNTTQQMEQIIEQLSRVMNTMPEYQQAKTQKTNEDIECEVAGRQECILTTTQEDGAVDEADERAQIMTALGRDLTRLKDFLARTSTSAHVEMHDPVVEDKKRRAMTDAQAEQRVKDLEDKYLEELDKLSNRFRQQKIDLIGILQTEKREMQERLRLERTTSIDEMERSYEDKLNEERAMWKNIAQDYQKEIDVMKFELQNIERNCHTAMEELKREHEQQLHDAHAGLQRERRQWRQVVTEKMISRMVQTQFGSRKIPM